MHLERASQLHGHIIIGENMTGRVEKRASLNWRRPQAALRVVKAVFGDVVEFGEEPVGD